MNTTEFTEKDFQEQVLIYGKILAFLLFLTGVTFLQPLFVSQGLEGTLFLQIVLASIKGFLIVAYYMHLKTASDVIKWTVYFTVFILGILFVIVGIDSNMDDSALDMFQAVTASH